MSVVRYFGKAPQRTRLPAMSAADARWQFRMSGAVAILWLAALVFWVVYCAFNPLAPDAERHERPAAEKVTFRR